MRGPRSTRSPTKIALRPVRRGGHRAIAVPASRVAELRQQLLQLVGAAVHVADDVERAGVVALVGPQRRRAIDRGRVDSPRPSAARETWRKPSRCRPRIERRSCRHLAAHDVRRRTARSGRACCARCRRSRAGRGRWRPAARASRRASSTRPLRVLGAARWSRRSTVSRRCFSRFSAMSCTRSKASAVAAWSFSSSATQPRQQSDEMTSVGRKCLRGEGRLARAGRADQHDEREVGDRSDLHRVKTAIWVGAPSAGSSLADAVEAHRVAIARGDALRPRPRTPRASIRSGGRGWRNAPAARLANSALYSAFGVVITITVSGRAWPNSDRSKAGSRVGSSARSPRPRRRRRSPASARRDRSARRAAARSACAGARGMRSSCSRSRGAARAPRREARRRRSAEAAFLEQAAQQPALAAAEIEHACARRLRERRDHGCHALVVEPDRLLERLLGASACAARLRRPRRLVRLGAAAPAPSRASERPASR